MSSKSTKAARQARISQVIEDGERRTLAVRREGDLAAEVEKQGMAAGYPCPQCGFWGCGETCR